MCQNGVNMPMLKHSLDRDTTWFANCKDVLGTYAVVFVHVALGLLSVQPSKAALLQHMVLVLETD